MNPRELFATNKDKEEKGVWVKGPQGSEYLIARVGNTSFSKLSAELMRPHRKLIQMGKADDALLTDIAAEITSRTVLLDWKGVKDDAGKDVPYSQAAAKEYMVKYPDFADMISGFGQQISLFQDKEQEERVKNS
jgi:hypothetical protein